jgi:hypothetical protein
MYQTPNLFKGKILMKLNNQELLFFAARPQAQDVYLLLREKLFEKEGVRFYCSQNADFLFFAAGVCMRLAPACQKAWSKSNHGFNLPSLGIGKPAPFWKSRAKARQIYMPCGA